MKEINYLLCGDLDLDELLEREEVLLPYVDLSEDVLDLGGVLERGLIPLLPLGLVGVLGRLGGLAREVDLEGMLVHSPVDRSLLSCPTSFVQVFIPVELV
jgi:hypothetical protein